MHPAILVLELPREEWAGGELLYQMLPGLNEAITEFEESIALAKDVKEHNIRWHAIAVKYGAVAIYNFWEVKRTLRKLFQECPTLEARVDFAVFDEADSLFDAKFPSAEPLRTAVVHPGRIYRTTDERNKNSFHGTVIRFMFNDGQAQVIMGNALHYYYPSKATAAGLKEVRDLIYKAIEPAAQHTRDLREQRIARGEPQPMP